MIKLEDAPLLERVEMLRLQHQPGERSVVSDAQAVRLDGISERQDAAAFVALGIMTGLEALSDNPSIEVSAAWAVTALQIALAHPDVPDEATLLGTQPEDYAEWIQGMLEQVGPEVWSFDELVWNLSMALLTGWPETSVRLEEGLGQWQLGQGDKLFQILLDAAVLHNWDLL